MAQWTTQSSKFSGNGQSADTPTKAIAGSRISISTTSETANGSSRVHSPARTRNLNPFTSSTPLILPFDATSRSLETPIPMTLNGRHTSHSDNDNPDNRVFLREAACFNERLEGLSRMRGNSHVRFLGEERMATSFPYPTKRRDAPRFQAFFPALSFFRFDGEARPTHRK